MINDAAAAAKQTGHGGVRRIRQASSAQRCKMTDFRPLIFISWISECGSLKMAKSRNKNFRAQFLFHAKIKTTYQNILPTTEILELRSKRGSQ